MAIGRTNAGGAGGAELNFTVVPGLTQPVSAQENTIWVKTEKLNSYYFSPNEPENMADYDVWFSTGTSSTVEFNALKKNGIQVCPISAVQRINGALVDVTAKSYQSGEWVDWWNGELYQNGNEYSFITGGWNGTGLTKSNNKLVISGVSNNKGVAYTEEVVDLTNYKTVEVTVTCTLSSTAAAAIIITTNQTAIDSEAGVLAKLVLSPNGTYTDETFSLSIPSGLPSKYYIKLFWYSQRSASTMSVSKVRMK